MFLNHGDWDAKCVLIGLVGGVCWGTLFMIVISEKEALVPFVAFPFVGIVLGALFGADLHNVRIHFEFNPVVSIIVGIVFVIWCAFAVTPLSLGTQILGGPSWLWGPPIGGLVGAVLGIAQARSWHRLWADW